MDFEGFDADVTHDDGCGDSSVKNGAVHNQLSKPWILARQTKQFTDS